LFRDIFSTELWIRLWKTTEFLREVKTNQHLVALCTALGEIESCESSLAPKALSKGDKSSRDDRGIQIN
jgi:hypothetical protein